MTIRNHADFLAGLLYLLIGSAFLWLGRGYDFGSPLRMGPGFFPTVLSVALIGLGAVVALRALAVPGEPIEGLALKGLALVTLGAVVFGLLVDRAGILVAVAALTVVSASASDRFRWSSALMLAALLAVFSAVVFVMALGLPMPIVGPLLGGGE